MDSPPTHPLRKATATFIEKEKLFNIRDRLILAVSGGLDSTVLCHILHGLGYGFEIAHMNFQLRGDESARDEKFVTQLAAHYRARIHVKRVDAKSYALEHGKGIQEAARELRYQWFEEICREPVQGLQPIDPKAQIPTPGGSKPGKKAVLVTAHHQDDNLETVLMHFFQGTGLAGLRGMLPATDRVARPLLFASRAALASYAEAHEISWVEDSSNAETLYSRNFMRHEIIPVIERLYPALRSNLSAQTERFRSIEAFTRHQLSIVQKKLCVVKGDEWHIPVQKLRQTTGAETLLHAMLAPKGFQPGQLKDLVHLLDAETGKQVLSSTHRIIRNRAWLILAPLEPAQPDLLVLDQLPYACNLGEKTASFEAISILPSTDALKDPAFQYIDSREVRFPLIIRRWRKADYFYPLGMRKKKKLSRFFIDEKLSALEKEKQWILESDGRILAVLGRRIDDRFKLSHSTRQIIRIGLS